MKVLYKDYGAASENRTRFSSLRNLHITIYVYAAKLAEKVGFEPTVDLRLLPISSRTP